METSQGVDCKGFVRMKLDKDRDKLSEHMNEARLRVRVELRHLLRRLHALSDESAAEDEVIEHRIWCMAANEVALMAQGIRITK